MSSQVEVISIKQTIKLDLKKDQTTIGKTKHGLKYIQITGLLLNGVWLSGQILIIFQVHRNCNAYRKKERYTDIY